VRRIALLPALLLLASIARAEGGEDLATTVAIDSGKIAGAWIDEDAGLRVYRGIPYAAPPVGDLRWRPPAPVKPWPGTRICTEFGAVCPQPNQAGASRVRQRMDESCLFLNVWTAAGPDGKRPVMVWIHGGGHVLGAGSMSVYDGAALARAGVVLITINYRLGPFGWLGHPGLSAETERGVSGNYGMLDQIAALRWVKRNVAAFGGDPGCVTIFGESAGAVSVSCLMVCPEAKGLFHRAIAQSGGPTGIVQRLREDRGKVRSLESRGIRIAQALGVAGAADPAAALRGVSAERLLEAARPEAATFDRERKYGPVVDGWLLPDEPMRLWKAGKQHDVPFLVGSNADDGGVFSRNVRARTAGAYRFLVRLAYGTHAEEVLARFPVADGDDPALVARRLLTVASFVRPARAMARAMEAVESPAWLYHFTRVPPLARRFGVGAAHGLEIPYVFGTFEPRMGMEEVDDRLAGAMRGAWVRFAATGDPNGEGLPRWPAHTAESDAHMEFGDEVRPGKDLHREACDLFDRLDK
jgi:para-nitrobenzyl esterase